jgi:hypothetical protein
VKKGENWNFPNSHGHCIEGVSQIIMLEKYASRFWTYNEYILDQKSENYDQQPGYPISGNPQPGWPISDVSAWHYQRVCYYG